MRHGLWDFFGERVQRWSAVLITSHEVCMLSTWLIPAGADLHHLADRYIYCKVSLFFPFPYCILLKESHYSQITLKEWGVMFYLLKCLVFLFAKAARQPYQRSVANQLPSATMLSLPLPEWILLLPISGSPGSTQATASSSKILYYCPLLIMLPTCPPHQWDCQLRRTKSGSYDCFVPQRLHQSWPICACWSNLMDILTPGFFFLG